MEKNSKKKTIKMSCNVRTHVPFVPVMVVVVPSSHQTGLDLGPDLGPTTFQAPGGESQVVSVVDLDLDWDLGPAFQDIAGRDSGSGSGSGSVSVSGGVCARVNVDVRGSVSVNIEVNGSVGRSVAVSGSVDGVG